MKRANYLIEQIAEPDNLRLAFWKARKGKPYSQKVEDYRLNLDRHLLELRQQILRGKVKVGEYYYFKIYDPKERQICASAFRERVLHHALMNICHPYFDRYQIEHSYASRPEKGVHAGINKAMKFTKTNKWFLKLDVKKYFANIDHAILNEQLAKRFKEYRLLTIFDQIIASYEETNGRGLPIGNLASQYFANHYLVALDRFIKQKLSCKSYVRYMDDMVLWHEDKNWLKDAHWQIEVFVNDQLNCNLKPSLLNKVERGLPFCGYLIRPEQIKLTQRSKKRYIRKLSHLLYNYNNGYWTEAECQRKVVPLIAFTRFANATRFRQKVLFEINGH